ncbi:hypothetical protein, partial [Promineifilum sp.]|uniref:hypothetical protein n=1 Tax=Promineifilum sp. TaxID=2664178 RepID=UPI0035B0C0DB
MSKKKSVVAYILRGGEDATGRYRAEIEIQRDSEIGERSIRRYRSTPRRRWLIEQAALIWN